MIALPRLLRCTVGFRNGSVAAAETMSAMAAAFVESGHDGPIPRDRAEYWPSKVRQVAPRRAAKPVSMRFGARALFG